MSWWYVITHPLYAVHLQVCGAPFYIAGNYLIDRCGYWWL